MKRLVAAVLLSSILQADPSYFVTADFLYWFAKETDLSYALEVRGVNQIQGIPLSPTLLAARRVEHLDPSWAPGARAGLGYTFCNGWDIYSNWTYFHTMKEARQSVPSFGSTSVPFYPDAGQFALVDPWINVGTFTTVFDAPFLFDTVAATWEFTLNLVDLELGYKLYLCDCFALRPYAGVRAALLNLEFQTKASATPSSTETVSFDDRFKTKISGAGLLIGLQPEWFFSDRFSLFANVDTALLWEQNINHKKEHYFGTAASGIFRIIDYTNKVRNNVSQFQAVLDLALGFSWKENWCCNCYSTSVDLSWEQHFWFDAVRRIKFNTAFLNDLGGGLLQFGFQGYEEISNNLFFGGPVLHISFGF